MLLRGILIEEGWNNCPIWEAILEGERPARPRPTAAGPGDWPHWQFHTAPALALPPGSRAMRLSHAEQAMLPCSWHCAVA